MYVRQQTFANMEIFQSIKQSKVGDELEKINTIINWNKVLGIVQVVDYASKKPNFMIPQFAQ